MIKKVIYNRVMDSYSPVCPFGELLTDKELEHIQLYSSRRDWPTTAKVKVRVKEVYHSFGIRFAENYELINEEK